MSECKGNLGIMFDLNKSIVKLLELLNSHPPIHPSLPSSRAPPVLLLVRLSVHLMVGQLVGWLVSQTVSVDLLNSVFHVDFY